MSTDILDDTIHFYDPAKGHGLKHDPFKAIVAPRPIGWISSRDAQGRVNLAPYSFFNAFFDKPPIIAFGSAGRRDNGNGKDSLSNIEATGEFVANMVTKPLAEAMNKTAATVPHGVDEFTISGLTPAPGRNVKVPRVAESPTALECKLLQVLQLQDLDGNKLDGWMVIGQVVGVHIDKAYLKDGIFDTAAAAPIMRAGYMADYVATTPDTMFQMIRPK